MNFKVEKDSLLELGETAQNSSTTTPTRRSLLRKLGLGTLLAGSTFVISRPDNAFALVYTNNPSIGSLFLPGKTAKVTGTAPGGFTYGLVTSSLSSFDLSTLPSSNTGAVIKGGTTGLVVTGDGVAIAAASSTGVAITASGSIGLNSSSPTGTGIITSGKTALTATGTNTAIMASSTTGTAVSATSTSGPAINATSSTGPGLIASGATGVSGTSPAGVGMLAQSTTGVPLSVKASSTPSTGTRTTGDIFVNQSGQLNIYNGNSWNTLVPKFADVIDTSQPPYNIVGKGGTVDCTQGFQKLFDDLSQNYVTGQSARSVYLYTPADDYVITQTISYVGNPGDGFRWVGSVGSARGGSFAGTQFHWGGAPGGKMFHFMGINGTTFEHLNFYGGTADGVPLHSCKTVVHLDAYDYSAKTTGPHYTGSSGCTFYRCTFGGAAGPGSALVGLGDEAGQLEIQCSEMEWISCNFLGNDNPDPAQVTEACWKTFTGGNTKNFRFFGGSAAYAKYLIDWQNASGSLFISGMTMAGTHDTVIRMSNSTLIMDSVEIENAVPSSLLTMFAGGGQGTAALRNIAYFGPLPADNIGIRAAGMVSLENSVLWNQAPGGPLQDWKMSINGLYSVGNTYSVGQPTAREAQQRLLLVDGSGNDPTATINPSYYKPIGYSRISSFNDTLTGQDGNARPIPARAGVATGYVFLTPAGINNDIVATGVSGQYFGEVREGTSELIFDYTMFKEANSTADVILMLLYPGQKLCELVAYTDKPYTGTYIGSGLQLSIGLTDHAATEIIPLHNVTAGPVEKGLVSSDYGSAMTGAAAAVGGGLWAGRVSNTPILIRLNLKSNDGTAISTVGLTGGRTIFNVTIKTIRNYII